MLCEHERLKPKVSTLGAKSKGGCIPGLDAARLCSLGKPVLAIYVEFRVSSISAMERIRTSKSGASPNIIDLVFS